MYPFFSNYWLKIALILTLATSFLKATTAYALNIPETRSIPKGSHLIVQNPEPPKTEQQPHTENCAYQPAPLPVNSQPFSLLKLQVDNRTIDIQLQGNTVLSRKKILKVEGIKTIIEQYEGKTVTKEQLQIIYQQLAKGITQLYLNEGYITSQASPLNSVTINDQGVVIIPVTEGRIEEIQIVDRGRLKLSYLCSRIALGVSSPLNIIKLEDQLRLLNGNSVLSNVSAELKATGKSGLSLLVVTVKEAESFKGNISADNYSPPSLGSERLGVGLSYNNVTGIGDQVSINYYNSTTSGNRYLDFGYQVPLNPMEGTLQFRINPSWTRLTQPPLDQFDITGQNQSYQIIYRQPLIRNLREELALSLGFQYQDGRTLGLGLQSLQNTNSSVVQFGQDYTRRDGTEIWLVRSQFTWGIGNQNSGDFPSQVDLPQGMFLIWLGQVQRLQRIGNDHLLIIQGDIQLASNPLIPSYLFIIGGGQSVRGYRQNARSGDNGLRFSVEDRITLVRDNKGNSYFQIAPFIDLGQVWNASGNPFISPSQNFLIGTGLGLIWNPFENLTIRLDYGIPWVSIDNLGNNAQDDGFYFQINLSN